MADETSIFGILRQPKTNPLARAKMNVGLLRRISLNVGEQVRIKRQLKHMAGGGLAFQFDVQHLIGKRPQFRRGRDALQKICVSAPHATPKRGLKNNIRPGLQGVPGGF